MWQNNNKSDYISTINILRGIAALSVVIFHFVCTTTGFIKNELVKGIFGFGALGVEMFFIISGVVIPLSMLRYKYTYNKIVFFLKKRLCRIEPPYLITVFLCVAFFYLRYIILGDIRFYSITINDILMHLVYLVPFFENSEWFSPIFWTLAIEFQFYLFMALFLPFLTNKNLIFRAIFHILILVSPFFTERGFFPYWSTFFALGIYYVVWKKNLITKAEFLVMFILCLSINLYIHSIPAIIVALGTLFLIEFKPNINSAKGNFLGKISYSLYLTHGLTGQAFINILSKKITFVYEKITLFILGVIIAIFLSYVFYRLIEKPSQSLARKIK